MIVQCGQCNKRFKLNPDVIKGASARVRCSNCQHVFRVARPEPVDIMEMAAVSLEGESRRPTRQAPRRRLLIFLIPVLLILGGIAVWLYLPRPLRPKPAHTRADIEQLHLVATSASFIDNRHNGQLFYIQGRVRNEFSEPRRWIRLRAKLLYTDGRIARELDFYAGNPLSKEQLQSMPLEDLIALIQQRPDADKGPSLIAAQEEVSFTVPFGDLPELTKLSDYSVEILESQPS